MFLIGDYNYELDIKVQREEAFEDGMEKGTKETAKKMIQKGLSIDLISDCTGLTEEQVKELQA